MSASDIADIVAFFRDRIDERERDVRRWAVDAAYEDSDIEDPDTAEPSPQALRSIAAQRRLIAEYENSYRQETQAGLELALRVLVSEWSTHESYREGWKL